jgi:hypothetical protein
MRGLRRDQRRRQARVCFVCSIALLRTKVRTFIYEEIGSLPCFYFPFRVRTPDFVMPSTACFLPTYTAAVGPPTLPYADAKRVGEVRSDAPPTPHINLSAIHSSFRRQHRFSLV